MPCRNFKHGYSRTKLYNTWYDMIRRCTNLNDRAYKYYGGRGITVCKEWSEDFLIFRFQMRKKYLIAKKKYKGEQFSIERINNNKGYYYKNCIFVSHKLQNKNKRNVIPCKATNRKSKKEVYGETKKELAEKIDMSERTVGRAINNKQKTKNWIIRPLLKPIINKRSL